MTILDDILQHKRDEVAAARRALPADRLADQAEAAPATRGLRRALERAEAPRVIAELKRRSPSKGLIRADFDPQEIARSYAEGGAAALSVLTDEPFFGGSLAILASVREVTPLPILRKDFVVDPYQVDEARAAGADAILLIVAALEPDDLQRLRTHALGRDLDVLVEVHDEAELEIAVAAGADLIGINNRDLRSFETDLGTTERLAGLVPRGAMVVAESGIVAHEDIERLERAGTWAFLVGESLMRHADVGLALQRLRGKV